MSGNWDYANSYGKINPAGTKIHGPFENDRFTTEHNELLANLGCSPASKGHTIGGLDTQTVEKIISYNCGIKLPVTLDDKQPYAGLLDQDGGHGKNGAFYSDQDFHYHGKMDSLYQDVEKSTHQGLGHSPKIGKESNTSSFLKDSNAKFIYGKWENFASKTLPKLDACGGHFGVTPDSNCEYVY